MAEVITRTKNQIRPRSEKIRFNNDALLAMSDDGLPRMLVPASFPSSVIIEGIFAIANIVTPYGAIDSPNCFMQGDFANSFNNDNGVFYFANTGGTTTLMDDLFTVAGLNCAQAITQQVAWATAAPGTVELQNGGFADQGQMEVSIINSVIWTGGDSANYLDLFVYYWLVN